MITSWMRAQDRRRGLVAAASTACLYALAFVGAWLIGSLAPASLATVPGTVIVDLGGTEGPPGETPQGLETAPLRPTEEPTGAAPIPAASASPVAPSPEATPAPANSAPGAAIISAPAKAAPAAPKTAAPSAKSIPSKSAAAAQAESSAALAAQERAAQEDAALRAAAASAAAPPGPPKTRTFGSSSSAAPVSSGAAGSEPGVAGGTGSVTFRGSEMGSALATTFGASSGQVGRNIYVPIYLYMPLPSKVGASIYLNIQAKETFRSYYGESGSDWILKAQVPLAQRGDFWTMLEAAGYDASTADFRTERKLSPVVLEFAVGPLTKGKAELVEVRLASSSGSSEVDQAVIYGFSQASFFNKTGNAVAGKFVYSF
jgi:hypothetical protein